MLEINEKNLNSSLSITSQAYMLPYDASYDVRMSDLSLGSRLGSGAFGEVLQAEVQGLIQGEQKTMVAAKRVKDSTKDEYMKALISELKLMIFVGSHQSVVKILGVVRENIINGKILVLIVVHTSDS